MDGRDELGRFTVGNPGGPGRPRRAVELDYLRALSDAIGLDDWREIVQRAVTDAKAGDVKAREWIAAHVIPERRPTLIELAALDAQGLDGDDLVAVQADGVFGVVHQARAGRLRRAEAARAEAEAEAARARADRRRAARAGRFDGAQSGDVEPAAD